VTAAHDVIVVGARCAGSPTAMLLARKGYRVLVVDRATFPSDTVSTHVLHPLGVAALERWGLLQRLVVTGCPPIHTYTFDFGPFTIEGSPGTMDSPVAYCLAAQCSTRCWPTLPPKPASRFVKAFRWTRS
jgi:2-polyprenyl-6-methoxyphenol hydroxylase-like FAD-dependent oxidoreductase